jgi:hypothetical protein
MDLDDAKTTNNSDRSPGVGDLVEVYSFTPKKWISLRLLSGLHSTAVYWVRTKTKSGKDTKFPTVCPSYDPETQERDSEKYDPWRDLQREEYDNAQDSDMDKEKARSQARIQYSQNFWMQAIVRGLQKQQPGRLPKPTAEERKSGFKDKDSDSWTPVRAVRIGKSLAGKIQKLKSLNTVESKSGAVKAFAVNDQKYGRDVRVYFDPDAAPADQYQVQLGDKRSPLDEDEQAYLLQDLETATEKAMTVANEKEIRRDFESWAHRNSVKLKTSKAKKSDDNEQEDYDSDDDFDDEPRSKKGSKVAPKKSKNSKSIDEDDSDSNEDFDDDDEDDEPRHNTSKSSKAKTIKSKNSDEDEFDDLEDDEDEKPRRTIKSKLTKSSKKNVEEDFEDEDEEEPKKKQVKSSSKKSSKSEEDDDFDDFDEDEKPRRTIKSKSTKKSDDFDDEDEPKKPVKKTATKKSNDEDDDFDEESDDDEEKPKRAIKSSSKKTRKSNDDDDDF